MLVSFNMQDNVYVHVLTYKPDLQRTFKLIVFKVIRVLSVLSIFIK